MANESALEDLKGEELDENNLPQLYQELAQIRRQMTKQEFTKWELLPYEQMIEKRRDEMFVRLLIKGREIKTK